jgi:glycosyltransferase involved in cell wall biosynthesis
VKILYLNHTSQVSGAELSLLALMVLARAEAEVALVCPRGELMERATAIGVETITLEVPQVGFSSGWFGTVEAALRYARAGVQVRRIARQGRFDYVHAGSVRAGLLAAFCLLTHPRRLTDVRDALPAGGKATVVKLALRLTAHVIVFNSEYTRARFGFSKPARSLVIYPSIDLAPFLRLPLQERGRNPLTLGVIGQITPWKGQDDAVRILEFVRRKFPDTRLRIVGGVVFTGGGVSFDNVQFEQHLRALVAERGLQDAVEFVGEVEEIPSVLASVDVLLAPSWQEPFGRVVAEAMASGVPVVATSVGGPGELIEHGVNGFLAPPRNPEAWVESVSRLLESEELSQSMAVEARARISASLARDDPGDRMRLLYGVTRRQTTSRRRSCATS